jgi:hypothetical protein
MENVHQIEEFNTNLDEQFNLSDFLKEPYNSSLKIGSLDKKETEDLENFDSVDILVQEQRRNMGPYHEKTELLIGELDYLNKEIKDLQLSLDSAILKKKEQFHHT